MESGRTESEDQARQVRELLGEVARNEGEMIRQQREIAELNRRMTMLDSERRWLREQIREMASTRFWRLGRLYWQIHARLSSLTTRRHPASSTPAGESAPRTRAEQPPSSPLRPQAEKRASGISHEIVLQDIPTDARVVLLDAAGEVPANLGARQVIPFHPSGSQPGARPLAGATSAIVRLEVLRSQGAGFLLITEAAFTWFDRLAEFRRHVEDRYPLVLKQDGAFRLFSLGVPGKGGAAPWALLKQVIDEFQYRHDRDPAVLDWNTGLNLAEAFPGPVIFSPPASGPTLPYLDASVDLVAIANPEELAEARRVASSAVVTCAPGGTAEWKESARRESTSSVSIIIPCHNAAQFTGACLKALSETLPHSFDGEIVVVDDASTDGTPALLGEWTQRDSRIKVLRNEVNAGFAASCNRAAAAATGEYIVLLNNDTIPLPGWLPALLRTFREHTDAGAVGAKLILPDGSLQEAGGVVFSDGSAANFGRGETDLEAPLFNYVRAVDYSSGACLATKRVLFLGLGGFDPRYEPAYYEDVDYGFQLRLRGCCVYFQPECLVVHAEGGTSGTDPTKDAKRYQVVNQAKFVEKWRDALQSQPTPPDDFDLGTWHRLAARGQGAGDSSR